MIAAIVVLLGSELSPAAEARPEAAMKPVIAQFQFRPTEKERNEPPVQQSVSAIGINAVGYTVTVIIPIMLFITMVGFARRNDA